MNLSNGYTGHLFEEEVLGTCTVKWSGYMTYRDAMNEVRSHQPGSPTCPRNELARKFQLAVAAEMNVCPSELRFYTAVGSTLDRFHSVDGFFEFNGLVVTIDVTLNEQKARYRANVIVSMQDVSNDFCIAAMKVADSFKWAGRGRADALRV